MPDSWQINRFLPFGAPFELLENTSADVEKGFQPPPDFKGKGALKFSIVKQLPDSIFQEVYTPEEMRRRIDYTGGTQTFTIQTETDYTLSFWVKTTGRVTDLQWQMTGYQVDADTNDHIWQQLDGAVSNGGTWDHFTQTFQMRTKVPDKRHIDVLMNLKLTWLGDGTLYFDDFRLTKKP